MLKFFCCVLFFISCLLNTVISQSTVRPMIWVKPEDKQAILDDIDKHTWKKEYYQAFVNRVQADVAAYYENPKQYLSGLPFNLSAQKPGQIPPFFYINNPDKEAATRRNKLQHYLKNAIDCSIIYFLTNDEKYVKYSTSVFYTFLKSMLQLKASETPFNGGLIYQDDHLRESREVGAQMPVLYDFIYPYISKGGKGYNFVTDTYETVSVTEAETIFRTYVNLALGRGIIDCNWPVLESSSLVCNTLALNSESERKYFLQYYLVRDTTHQDALAKVAAVYKKEINWPESLNYSSGVAKLSTYLMTLLTKLDSSLHLGRKYPEILRAVTLPYYLTYPNNTQQILFGDGGRSYRHPIVNYELAYFLGKLENSSSIQNEFGSLLNTALQEPAYKRSALNARSYVPEPYFEEPLKLLWFCPEIAGEVKAYPKPVTVELPFAGILLQRNLSSSTNPKHGLMAFVGGGAFIHGHASGMNMELYGQGHVLGTKAGKGAYGTEIHENYYRLFASHNTVVVNGSSRGEGGWVNLAINTVSKVAMEPVAYKKPVSGNYSFTTSGFLDDKGDSAEAKQERTLGIIRTSAATGYYIDVFRSESKLPNQYHDYIYHNIGDTLIFNTNDKDFVLKSNDERFKIPQTKRWSSDEEKLVTSKTPNWKSNSSFINPGWHYFNTVETSNRYEKNLEVLFEANALGKQPVNMKLFVTGDKNREYTKTLAPPSVESVKAYTNKPTPTLVIRKKGEAWQNPFVVVYESFTGTKHEGQIKSVESILQRGIFKGVIVNSIVNGKAIKQIIISQDSDESVFEDKDLEIKFKGRYAVLTLNAKSQLAELYIGNGTQFSYQKWSVSAADAKAVSLSLTISGKNGISNANGKFNISHPEGFNLTESIINND